MDLDSQCANVDDMLAVSKRLAIIKEGFIKQIKSEANMARAEIFFNQFLGKTAIEDFKILEDELIIELINSIWDLFNCRQPDEIKIHIYEKKVRQDNLKTRLVIDIVNDNMPFLIDSFIGYLSQYGLRSKVLIRSVLKVQREDNGNLKAIDAPELPNQLFNPESVIHCEISGPVAKDLVAKIEQELHSVFANIKSAVLDWQSIRNKIQQTMGYFHPITNVLDGAQVAESMEFLQWIDNDHFTFLGYREYTLDLTANCYKPAKEGLGILRLEENKELCVLYRNTPLTKEAVDYIFENDAVVVTKSTVKSKVHRMVPMDSVTVKKFDEDGQVIGLCQFIGLFTSMAYSSSARDIPLLRRKVMTVVEKSGFSADWHDGKAIIHILDTLPRDELFQASVQDLHDLSSRVLEIQETQKVALFLRKDKFDRFLSCMVYIPRDRFEYELIEEIRLILAHDLHGNVALSSAQYGNLSFARIHYTADHLHDKSARFDIDKIEKKLAQAAHSWPDTLKNVINESFDEWESLELVNKYHKAFNKGYQERFSENVAITDIGYLEEIITTQGIKAHLYRHDHKTSDHLKLKIFNYKDAIPLADILPILENLDFRVNGEVPFTVKPADSHEPLWIHDFDMESLGHCPIDLAQVQDKFLAAFYKVWHKEIENDVFNRLVVRAGLTWRQCLVFRAYAKYLKQLQKPFSQDYLAATLVKNPVITAKIVTFFETKFDVHNTFKITQASVLAEITELLISVRNPEEDRILRYFINLIKATIRTNFYQLDNNKDFKSYLSFKFDCSQIEDMPLPRPKFEIFIYSARFEALHLRGGKVARGGIRWSDRREDFRTEILGLLKAQMVKNAVIVPTGSKGGFILKAETQFMTREELQAEGIACYQEMITAMLEITDNLVDHQVILPTNVLCKDEPDTYLVVAADKGTATFSDYANAISTAHKFWLDDAFASGGSYGYDHKKMGITAKGAWVSVTRHFYEMGIDLNSQEITAVGVGDMSGDVFGNGMILSKHLKLVAAFNHRHIFIDPNPDPATSFAERQRLFNEVKSWDAYNPELISKGGGVYDRSEKTLTISDEAKQQLGLLDNIISPNELIKIILKSPVDLLWFGGIGTYLKAKAETHAEVGDRANDSVRVNASELKCKVIGEGANLGVTQRGRIEFARKGGYINTDAIDNSGGVDCSDHEVNIKILLQAVVAKGELDFKERNKLLEEMTPDVSNLVLQTNYQQNLALSLLCFVAPQLIDTQIKLMHELEKEERLDRVLEYLPDDTVLYDLQNSHHGLTRPEISVLLPYAKNSLYDKIMATDFPASPIAQQNLYDYFPVVLQQRYRQEIDQHPLRREIIATMVANQIVNRMGPSFENELMESTGQSLEDVLSAYFLATAIFGFDDLWHRIDSTPDINAANQLQAFMVLWRMIKRVTEWFLKHVDSPIDVEFVNSIFNNGMQDLQDNLDDCIGAEIAQSLKENIQQYQQLGLSQHLSSDLAHMEIMVSSPDIIMIADNLHVPVPTVASIYFGISEKFDFTQLREIADNIKADTYWQRKALTGLIDDLYLLQSTIATSVTEYISLAKIKNNASAEEAINAWAADRQLIVNNVDTQLQEALKQVAPDVALLTVVNKALSNLAYS